MQEKESWSWIKSSSETKELLPENVTVTIIGDREIDIYENFDKVHDHRIKLLIRSRCDRKILENIKASTIYWIIRSLKEVLNWRLLDKKIVKKE